MENLRNIFYRKYAIFSDFVFTSQPVKVWSVGLVIRKYIFNKQGIRTIDWCDMLNFLKSICK